MNKSLLALLALMPLAWLVFAALFDPGLLGANPAEMITRNTGDWALRLLLLALAITPLRRLSGWHVLIDYRRLIGLLGFFYAVVHLASYISFDHVFDALAILKDVFKRPFITLGMLSLLLMLPLALTSTNAWVRRLGARRWLRLHRLVYAAGIVAVLHFWWMVKRDISEPLLYAVVLALLLGWRLRERRRRLTLAAGNARAHTDWAGTRARR